MSILGLGWLAFSVGIAQYTLLIIIARKLQRILDLMEEWEKR